jgi:hypothetical protein
MMINVSLLVSNSNDVLKTKYSLIWKEKNYGNKKICESFNLADFFKQS